MPEGKTEIAYIDELENQLREYVDKKIESYKAVQEFDTFKQSVQPTSPQCPICSNPMKPSKKGNKWLCVNSKWRMVNGQFVNNGCMGSLERNQ